MHAQHDLQSNIGSEITGDLKAGGVGARAAVVGHQAQVSITERNTIVNNHYSDPKALRNRRELLILLDKVRSFWVEGVLEKSLHNEAMLALGMTLQPGAVECPRGQVIHTPNGEQTVPAGKRIEMVFDEAGKAMLILGTPGNGKTTTLLELARELLFRAEKDPTAAVPVVFNLSSWAQHREPLFDWLVAEFKAQYYVPKKMARNWLRNNDLILLLDGLDEVNVRHRNRCVAAINQFRSDYSLPGMVVCSRAGDYANLASKLKLNTAIKIQPLCDAQIEMYVESGGEQLAALKQALKDDPALHEMARSPLMLSVASLAYRGVDSVVSKVATDDKRTRHRQVFAAYVERVCSHDNRSRTGGWTHEQTTRWLGWLARCMAAENQSFFLIEGLQPGWLLPGAQWQAYRITLGLFLGLLWGAIVGLSAELLMGLLIGLLAGLLVGLLVGGFAGLFVALGKIKAAEMLRWSWPITRENLAVGLVVGLAIGLVEIRVVETLGWSWLMIRENLILGLAIGVIGGLGVGQGSIKTKPNHGIWLAFRNGVIGRLVFGVVGGLVGGLSFGLVVGLCAGLIFGGAAFIQHFALRAVLIRAGKMPWRYARFLDHAAELALLRKVGGGYIFIHRALLEYFASLDG